ncbi:pentapeptide repeat-containing protein [Tenacibaculum dicentrarchi]|uniref:pentapeptide repeat-containing protein n=1 Tax=Tenacibaculum dicentrarchi TaxID=669041 RepID=UPI0035159379
MLSEKRLIYFLRTKYEDLEGYEYKELVDNYFIKPKDDWYEEKDINGRKEKIWDKTKVAIFWMLIREHAMKFGIKNKKFDFSKFVFPDFEKSDFKENKDGTSRFTKNFWNRGESKEFSEDVIFLPAKFLGEADFSGTLFKKKVGFNAVFFEKANFKEAKFSKEANFSFSKFSGKSVFSFSKFSGKSIFSYSKFLSETDICEVTFSGEAEFNKTKFLAPTNFQFTFFLENISFISTNFLEKCSFWGINFTNKTIFRGVNLKNAIFGQSDITEVKFKNCIWNENSSRIILNYEKGLGFEDDSNYKELEDLYRQLKVNFDNSKNWELSGKAYVSEMEMRRKIYQNEFLINIKSFHPIKAFIGLINWFLFIFYKVFGGYTQNYILPFLWLSLLFTVSLLVYSDYCFFQEYCECNFKPWKEAIDASFPFFKSDKNSQHLKWNYFQKISSSILLTFFILALRKRFRQ